MTSAITPSRIESWLQYFGQFQPSTEAGSRPMFQLMLQAVLPL
jgi:hypothetical protein